MTKVKINKGRLIGRGKVARVYKIAEDPHPLVRKEFSPIYPVRLWNWFFYKSLHPLATEVGYKYAYWKRRLAHRLCRYLDGNVHITDALQLSWRGFISNFIDGRHPTKKGRRKLYTTVKKLEDYFDYIGMPTWSFSRKNPFSGSNFLIQDKTIYVVDYEQSVPIPDSRGRIDYDTIYFDDVNSFMNENMQKILDKLGREEVRHLKEALQMSMKYHTQLDVRPKRTAKFVNRRGKKK